MEVKDIIRNRRIEMGYNMKELAERVGVSEGTISRWESGEIANMRRDKILLLANALDLSPAVIMGWEEPQRPTYYLDPAAAAFAQKYFNDPERRMLMDASEDVKAENIKLAAEMLRRMKETNPDG